MKLIRDDKVETSMIQQFKIIKIDENLFVKVSTLKWYYLTSNIKLTNFNIYNDKSFKKVKNWVYHNILNAFEIDFFYLFFKIH